MLLKNKLLKIATFSVFIFVILAIILVIKQSKINTTVEKIEKPPEQLILNEEHWSIKGTMTSKNSIFPLRTSSPYKNVVLNGCKNTNIFAYPYVIALKPNGFSIGIPEKKVSEKSVGLITHMNFDVNIGDLITCNVNNVDELTFELYLESVSGNYIKLTLAKGLGYVYYESNLENLPITGAVSEKFNNLTKIVSPNREYFIKTNLVGSTYSGEIYYLPTILIANIDEILSEEVAKPSIKVELASSSIKYKFNKKLLYYVTPQFTGSTLSNEGIDSIRGMLRPVFATELETSFKSNEIKFIDELKLRLKDTDKTVLEASFITDYANLAKPLFNDNEGIYWQGKKIFMLSNLIITADILGEKYLLEKETMLNMLSTQLKDWANYSGDLDKLYFNYDYTYGGLIPSNPEYGVDKYNDHLLQYGYLIYGFNTLAYYEKDTYSKYRTFVEYIIRDCASFNLNDSIFPYLRHFDLYELHSYASGLYYFADGNNMESSSEAINFWQSAYLWVKNDPKSNLNKNDYNFGFNAEVSSALIYYWNYATNESIFPTGYTGKVASILWEGKYDFATWFSGKPVHVYGIQMLPFGINSYYLKNPNADTVDTIASLTTEDIDWQDIIEAYKVINLKSSPESIDKVTITDSSLSKSWLYLLYLNF